MHRRNVCTNTIATGGGRNTGIVIPLMFLWYLLWFNVQLHSEDTPIVAVPRRESQLVPQALKPVMRALKDYRPGQCACHLCRILPTENLLEDAGGLLRSPFYPSGTSR